jgi:heme-degrading monooxygenase HmoA
MVLETAFISVTPGREDEFIAAVRKDGQPILAEAKGWLGLTVQRGVERASTVLLCISWDTLEDHTVGFREGPLFPRWRAVISPFFAEPPHVEHWVTAG